MVGEMVERERWEREEHTRSLPKLGETKQSSDASGPNRKDEDERGRMNKIKAKFILHDS